MHKAIKKFAKDMSNDDYENFDVIIRLEKILELLVNGVSMGDIKEAISLFDDEDVFHELICEDE